MADKQQLLSELQQALRNGTVSAADVQAVLPQNEAPAAIVAEVSPRQKTSVATIFYNIAGVLLFGVLLSIILQTPGSENFFLHVFLTFVVGTLLWGVVGVLGRQSASSDGTNGIEGALLVTGSLSVLTGAFIATFHSASNSDEGLLLYFALFFAIASALHFVADAIIKRLVLLATGIITGVTAFSFVLFHFLTELEVEFDIWAIVLIGIAAWLVVVTRFLAHSLYTGRLYPTTFDALALWSGLIIAYIASFGEYGALWLIILVFAVLGLFYLSVVQQKRYFLGTAASFLVLTLVTISFRFFSDFGITFSLFFSLIAILGSAYAVSQLNKRYFKG